MFPITCSWLLLRQDMGKAIYQITQSTPSFRITHTLLLGKYNFFSFLKNINAKEQIDSYAKGDESDKRNMMKSFRNLLITLLTELDFKFFRNGELQNLINEYNQKMRDTILKSNQIRRTSSRTSSIQNQNHEIFRDSIASSISKHGSKILGSSISESIIFDDTKNQTSDNHDKKGMFFDILSILSPNVSEGEKKSFNSIFPGIYMTHIQNQSITPEFTIKSGIFIVKLFNILENLGIRVYAFLDDFQVPWGIVHHHIYHCHN